MKTVRRALAIVLLLAFGRAQPAWAAAISLDGQFDDWAGQANVGDPAGDAQTDHTDLQAFYFADAAGADTVYFMAERWAAGSEGMVLYLYVDADNDGSYGGANDRLVVVDYQPNPSGLVDVDVYDGAGTHLKTVASEAAWGEAGPQGRRVEWGLTYADLGIVPYQTIRLQLVSMQGNTASDGAPEVQWSPANALGWPLLVGLAAAGIAWLVYRRRTST
jgi:hypothetical protein